MTTARFLALAGVLMLALSACSRSGPPAPVEYRGIGTGEVRPGYSRSAPAASSSAPVVTQAYTPPAGYGTANSYGTSSIQAQPLGEPDDAYAQAASRPAPASSTYVAPSQPYQNAPQTAQPAPQQSAGNAYAQAHPDVPAISQGDGPFGWPVRGRIIDSFGDRPNGQSSDGLNIAATKGSSVYAAKEGTVAYAGSDLKGMGRMVLLRHSGGMFTVYAHLDQMWVKKGDSVRKGQPVGSVGDSGGVGEPQLHFEVRKGSSPQDPMKYLGR